MPPPLCISAWGSSMDPYEAVVSVAREPGDSPDAQLLMQRLSATLLSITGDSGGRSFKPEDILQPASCFAIARDPDGTAVGCGAFRPLSAQIAELKRMYAVTSSRGTGSALLFFLESEARGCGYQQIWLETRRVNQRAVSFYLRHGYLPIENYGRYLGNPAAVCFGKRLA